MSTTDEKEVRALRRLIVLVEGMLSNGVVNAEVYNQMSRFDKLLSNLPEGTDDTFRNRSETIFANLWTKIGEIEAKKEAATVTSNFRDLPTDPLPSWNGELDTFFAFWNSFSKRVLEQDSITEYEKLSRLNTALPESTRIFIVNMSLNDAKQTLIEKFMSRRAISDYLAKKFDKISIKGNIKTEELSMVAETLQIGTRLIEPIEESEKPMIKNLIFRKAHSLLPSIMRSKFWDQHEDDDPKLLLGFIKRQIRNVRSEKEAFCKLPNFRTDECRYCHETGHFVRGCPKKQSIQCYKCEEMGHIARLCTNAPVQLCTKPDPKKAQDNTSFANTPFRAKPKSKNNDQNAKSHVNVVAESAISDDELKSVKSYSISSVSESNIADDESDDEIIIDGTINGVRIPLLLDTGASRCLLPANKFEPCLMETNFRSATGHKIASSGSKRCMLEIDGVTLPINAHVNDHNLAILGRDFTSKCTFVSDGSHTQKVLYHKDGKKITIFNRDNFLKKKKMVDAETPFSLNKICQIFPCALDDDLFDEEELQCDKVGPVDGSNRVKSLLRKWKHLSVGLGDTNVVTHRIYLRPGTRPIAKRSQRIAVKTAKKAEEAIQEMLRLGVIEESQSEWCSRIVPVDKKDGSLRVAIDFRPLNESSQTDSYPMPRIDAIIDKLQGAKFFSKIDLRQGYYQVRMHPDDKHLTAFQFGKRLYHFTRMPFGLASAPQTFQRLMDRVLHAFPFAECYLDDVIIFSSGIEEHLNHIEQIFRALDEANLRLNIDKCHFAVNEVEYLGYRINGTERTITSVKIDKLKHFPVPSDKRSLDSFIGVANQYRELIEDFAQKAQPLFDLKKRVKAKEKFAWSTEADAAFRGLRDELTRSPVVILPDYSLPFIVRCDASGSGMGGALLQEINGKRRIVEYASKFFNDTQKRYPTVEKEATAVDFVLQKWRHFLWGGNFTLETDHRPLQFLESMKNTHGKLARMYVRIQQFHPFSIKHIPGPQNIDADHLSRLVAAISLDYSEPDDIFYRRQKKPTDFVADEQGRFRFVGDGTDRLAIPKKHREHILRALHDEYGHVGIDRAIETARTRFFWPGMTQCIKNYVRACHSCAVSKGGPIPKAAMKPTVIEPNAPLERWHLDAIGPFSIPSSSGNKWILVAQDAFSKWPEAKAVSACTSQEIITWCKSNIIDRFGVPKQFISDNGSQLASKEFADFVKKYKIDHKFAAIHHHESNGIVERFNRTIEEMIRADLTRHDITSWDSLIDNVLLAYRTSPHAVTNISPYEILFGKAPRLPLDAELDISTPVSELSLGETQTLVKARIAEEAAKRKAKYDRAHKANFRDLDGCKVYWRNFTANPKEGKHLAPRFRGPFRAEKSDSEYNYKIFDKDGNHKVVHLDHLKLCHGDIPLAGGLRSRGRPRHTNTIVFHNSTNRKGRGGVGGTPSPNGPPNT